MTDAALPVTVQAVEEFTEAYLRSLGAKITKEGSRWSVALRDDPDTDLELDGAVLEVAEDPTEVDGDAFAVAPESAFVERLLDEAADRTPFHSFAITGDLVDIQLPQWLTDGQVTVENKTFTPYYDRQAICVLFHVGIETVSEYQREELRAVAIDLNDGDERPQLADTYLELTDEGHGDLPEGRDVDQKTVNDILDVARVSVEEDVSPIVRETRERATRAAEVELDEYRQFVRQRRDELNDETDRLTTRIEEITETIDSASDQAERVEALRQRKELRAELEDLRSELDDLNSQIEAGFPEKRRKIRDRHALSVRIRPVSITAISYERGDLEVVLEQDETEVKKSYAYAAGAGILDESACDWCGEQLTAENPMTLEESHTVGETCCGE